MSIDSRAVFMERIVAIGLSDFMARFNELGWTTYAEFAFATTHAPGQGDDEKFRAEVVVPLLGDASHLRVPAVRRLFFEAYTLAGADLKRRAEGTADDAPRKVPNEERFERRSALAARLPNLKLEGELDVSNRLIDTCVELYEENVLRYVAWEECTKLEMELQGKKKDNVWVPDSSGTIREKRVEVGAPNADLSSDLRLRFALTRRGLALDMGDVLAFEIHEKLVDALIAAYMKEPPPNFGKVTLDQIRLADLEAWRLMAVGSRKGIKRNENNVRPLDLLLPGIVVGVEFLMLLQPTPVAAKRAASGDSPAAAVTKRQRRRANAQRAAMDEAVAYFQKKGKKGGGKAGGGKKGGDRGNKGWAAGSSSDRPLPWMRPGKAAMPWQLVGKWSTNNGRRICFAFNLGECSEVAPGSACSKGFHICCEPNCGQNHPVFEHK